jgi:hypothetical protein
MTKDNKESELVCSYRYSNIDVSFLWLDRFSQTVYTLLALNFELMMTNSACFLLPGPLSVSFHVSCLAFLVLYYYYEPPTFPSKVI